MNYTVTWACETGKHMSTQARKTQVRRHVKHRN